MPDESKSKPKFDWPGWSCVLGVLGIISVLVVPPILRQQKQADLAEAISNARSFGLALVEFDGEYKTFPNDSTAIRVMEGSDSSFDVSGTSSNRLFRQLFAGNLTQSEVSFYAKIPGTHKPDGIVTPTEALKKGEVGFSYISGLSSKDDPATPLVLTPLIPGTTTFDPEPFNGKAIVLQIDCTVKVYSIQKDGHIYRDGIDLLSQKQPIWKGKAPDIRYPE